MGFGAGSSPEERRSRVTPDGEWVAWRRYGKKTIPDQSQAGIQTLYDPYRIRKVLKRTGKRGEGEWESIPFDQAVSEIVEDGKLFERVPGEESREVEGLSSICALRGPEVMARLRADAARVTAG